MKKTFFLILWLLFILVGCRAAIQPQNSVFREEKAKEGAIDPYVWDFGKAKEGKVLKHNFIFKNEAKGNLKIEKLGSSCGCMVPQAKKKILAPQESAIIEVNFNTKGYSGEVSQFVYVNTDNSLNPIIRLTVKARVEK